MRKLIVIAGAAASIAAAPTIASAFCGFSVAGADQKLYNNATQVVLMRHGTRTVLSMQNNYQGPADDFAMVVPVPVVLQEENVKTLPKEVFDRVDTMAAPRLVEYWEEDPCVTYPDYAEGEKVAMSADMKKDGDDTGTGRGYGVTVEAEFVVGEYQIVILSAKEATGLDSWLRDSGYKIPEGADALLKPYVTDGWKFFVAKVDSKKVTFDSKGNAMLSPLRFYYDSEDFTLPVRLGLMNAKDKQDLIVHILADGQRYEVENMKNVTIPTNLDVRDETRERFGEFYAALFDRTVDRNPGAVVTEYAWDAMSCDPCPGPTLGYEELATLGQDVLFTPMPAAKTKPADAKKKPTGDSDDPLDLIVDEPAARPAPPPPPPNNFSGAFVLTRLHVRYGPDDLKDDLVFKKADAIVGGREQLHDGKLEERARPDYMNNFQARYIIRHAWTGPVECKDPVYGRWGGPPDGKEHKTFAAKDTAFAPRGKADLEVMVAADVPEIDVRAKKPAAGSGRTDTAGAGAGSSGASDDKGEDKKAKRKGCGCQSAGTDGALALILAGFGVLWLWRRRRRQTE